MILHHPAVRKCSKCFRGGEGTAKDESSRSAAKTAIANPNYRSAVGAQLQSGFGMGADADDAATVSSASRALSHSRNVRFCSVLPVTNSWRRINRRRL